ncbi:MAG TPA: hypothetical protein ENJ02_07780 [Chloroflexi bacterium]|nr:hypothetical protein [Chloroflexota bacterium]
MSAPPIRIRGLVRFERSLREQMARGFTPQERRTWQEKTAAIIRQVEEICARYGMKPDDLPAPSRRAYRFLCRVPWDSLPERTPPEVASAAPEESRPRGGRVRLRNVLRACNALHREMQDAIWENKKKRPPSPQSAAFEGWLERIRGTAADIERLLGEQGASPAELPDRSRRAYQWLVYLSETENLRRHLQTLADLLRLWEQATARRRNPPSLEAALFHSAAAYRYRLRDGTLSATLSEGFAGAPQPVLRALVHIFLGERTPARTERVRAWVESPAYLRAQQALQAAARSPAAEGRGAVYDLSVLFNEVNARYFGGALPRPRLVWGGKLTRRKFGHYEPATDTIMLSPTLDSAGVPQFAVEFVLYHEMLHKALGVTRRNGRRYAHTPEFRRRERLFGRYEEAQAVLRALALEDG